MTGAERRARIIEATIDLVAKYGVYGATTARIAAAAGINEKTLYFHFPSKRELLIATLDTVFERASFTLLSRQEPNILERLRRAVELHWADESGFVHPLFEFVASSPQVDLRRELRIRHEAHVKLVVDLVEEGKSQGVIRPEVDSDQVAWEFYSIYWAEDIAYMLGFEEFESSPRASTMIDRILRDIST